MNLWARSRCRIVMIYCGILWNALDEPAEIWRVRFSAARLSLAGLDSDCSDDGADACGFNWGLGTQWRRPHNNCWVQFGPDEVFLATPVQLPARMDFAERHY